MSNPDRIDISVCMVSLNCWDVLQPCLKSLRRTEPSVSYEVIMVDNASSDETVSETERLFPEVQIIRNDRNVGFTIATNQAIRQSRGRMILWLNTDTILEPDTLPKLVQSLDQNPRAGIVGGKVLNADSSFQWQCRRGMPTPLASVAYLLGLDRLFPRSRTFGQYLLRYLPIDRPARVTAVSGCCLLARREVWDQIGQLDEEVFGFGEDIDWCVRAANAGWEVWYDPAASLIHLKGRGGAHVRPYRKVIAMHQCMWSFFRKHLSAQYPLVVSWIVRLGIWCSLAASLSRTWVQRTLSRA